MLCGIGHALHIREGMIPSAAERTDHADMVISLPDGILDGKHRIAVILFGRMAHDRDLHIKKLLFLQGIEVADDQVRCDPECFCMFIAEITGDRIVIG